LGPDKENVHRFLVTCDADSEALVTEELRRTGVVLLPGTWLDTGDVVLGSVLLASSELEFEALVACVEKSGSIFIRHLAPVDYEVPLTGTEEDVAVIATLVPELAGRVEPTKSFSVQTRILGVGKLPYRKVIVNETLSLALEQETGATMDCRWPEQVVSVLCLPTCAYVGFSPPDQNRSAWAGGKHLLKRDDNQVSRAEFKLLEALSVFGLTLPTRGKALDIGASPGGWTRVLAEQGLQVDAVDPGSLDPRLWGNRLITHVRKRIQEYSPGNKVFNVIANDMKMDARDSIEIMLSFAPRLTQEGIAIMTLKMPKLTNSADGARKALDMLRIDIEMLATRYEIIGARQLYHNRSEVTVAMRARR